MMNYGKKVKMNLREVLKEMDVEFYEAEGEAHSMVLSLTYR